MKILLSIIILSALSLAGAYIWLDKSLNKPMDGAGERVMVEIGAGLGVKGIAALLADRGIISSPYAFKWHVKNEDLAQKLQAGTYSLGPDMTVKEIVRVVSTGMALTDERSITFIEGWTLKDMDAYLAEAGVTRPGEFTAAAQKSYNYDFLQGRPDGFDLEGYIFPDTYKIFNNAVADDIVRKTLNNFEKKLDEELRAEIARQGKSVWEIITMASLIEKEVRGYEDMRLVSGVFWNRIKAGQALESCASLAYILGVNKKQYSYEDTRVDSVYNTYRHPGLPPGPVSNPGLNAIKAAVYPTPSNYFYFLSRADNGETVFSRTYEEHLRNKARYLP